MSSRHVASKDETWKTLIWQWISSTATIAQFTSAQFTLTWRHRCFILPLPGLDGDRLLGCDVISDLPYSPSRWCGTDDPRRTVATVGTARIPLSLLWSFKNERLKRTQTVPDADLFSRLSSLCDLSCYGRFPLAAFRHAICLLDVWMRLLNYLLFHYKNVRSHIM